MLDTITGALESVKAAVDIGKIIIDSGKAIDVANYKYKIAELLSLLAEAKISITEINDEIVSRDEKIKKLEEELKIKEDIKIEGVFYWLNGDGPFCTKCWDNDRKLIRVVPTYAWTCKCPACKNVYEQGNNPERELYHAWLLKNGFMP